MNLSARLIHKTLACEFSGPTPLTGARGAAMTHRATANQPHHAWFASTSGLVKTRMVADIAQRISELRRQADTVIVNINQTVVDTGTTFGECLNENPRFAIEQAIQQINVKGTTIKAPGISRREPVENRALIIWDDVEDYDTD